MIDKPSVELIDMGATALSSTDAHTIKEWHEQLTFWQKDEKNKYKDNTGFSMMIGKIKSTMLHGCPHSVGVMFVHHTTAGRLAATTGHYANLKHASIIDIVGCMGYMPEARAAAVSLMKITAKEEDEMRFVTCVKLEGSHSIADDGGRVDAPKGGDKRWNQWEKKADKQEE